jgi:Aldo/keto reductase family
VSPTQIVLAWLLYRSPDILPIPGTSSIEHLEQNVAGGSIRLTKEDTQSFPVFPSWWDHVERIALGGIYSFLGNKKFFEVSS